MPAPHSIASAPTPHIQTPYIKVFRSLPCSTPVPQTHNTTPVVLLTCCCCCRCCSALLSMSGHARSRSSDRRRKRRMATMPCCRERRPEGDCRAEGGRTREDVCNLKFHYAGPTVDCYPHVQHANAVSAAVTAFLPPPTDTKPTSLPTVPPLPERAFISSLQRVLLCGRLSTTAH